MLKNLENIGEESSREIAKEIARQIMEGEDIGQMSEGLYNAISKYGERIQEEILKEKSKGLHSTEDKKDE